VEKAPFPAPQNQHSNYIMHCVTLYTQFQRMSSTCVVNSTTVGAFVKLIIATISFVMTICPSVRMEQQHSPWMDIHEIGVCVYFSKFVKKVQVSLQSKKKRVYFTWSPKYIYEHISFTSKQNYKWSEGICREYRNAYFILNAFSFENRAFMR
jgi:hypothetical protein